MWAYQFQTIRWPIDLVEGAPGTFFDLITSEPPLTSIHSGNCMQPSLPLNGKRVKIRLVMIEQHYKLIQRSFKPSEICLHLHTSVLFSNGSASPIV